MIGRRKPGKFSAEWRERGVGDRGFTQKLGAFECRASINARLTRHGNELLLLCERTRRHARAYISLPRTTVATGVALNSPIMIYAPRRRGVAWCYCCMKVLSAFVLRELLLQQSCHGDTEQINMAGNSCASEYVNITM
ncbi:hypothetical protein J6590_015272 [Homalodisca vitripennis]|nr:hypothetical protein J6590_015272 [Homalodisca vitripennis]